jgi:hypothetical protein
MDSPEQAVMLLVKMTHPRSLQNKSLTLVTNSRYGNLRT